MEDEEIEKAITRLSEVHAMLVEGIDRGLIMMPRLQNFCLAHASEQPFYQFLTDIEETSARALQGYAFGSKNLNEFVSGIQDRAHFSDHHISAADLHGMGFDEKLQHMGDRLFSRMARIYSLQIKAIRERGRPAPDVAGLLRASGLHILEIPLYFHLEQGTIAEFFRGKVLEPHKSAIEKGKKFDSGRRKGAISHATAYIQKLVSDNPTDSAKLLFAKADKSIIGTMEQSTFIKKVSAAKNKTS
jgi:hypothetical protein